PANIVSWSAPSVTVTVPPDLQPGTYDAAVWEADLTSNTVPVSILNYVLPGPQDNPIPGTISIRVKDGVSASSVTAAHGDGPPTPLFPGDTDSVLSRWYQIAVPVGQETAKILEYAADTNVEWAEFE